MGINADILNRRTTRFVLWAPRPQNLPPQLVIGRLRNGNPPSLEHVRRVALAGAAGSSGLFEINAAACGLQPGLVYHYWFEIDDSRSGAQRPARISVTDPFATCIDWRVFPLVRPMLPSQPR
jgi:pullulanase